MSKTFFSVRLFLTMLLAGIGISGISQTLPTPFAGCIGTAFQTNSDVTQFQTINLATGAITSSFPLGFNMNAMGFNVTDSRIYGIEHSSTWVPTNNLVVMGEGYITTKIPLIYEPGVIPFSTQGYEVQEGSVSADGYMYVRVNTKLYKIDVDPSRTATFAHVYDTNITLPANYALDWAFAPTGVRYLYTVTKGDVLRLDVTTGTVIVLAPKVLSAGNDMFGTVFFDNTGNLYAKENRSGITYKVINVTQGANISASKFSNGQSSTHNDGARCASAPSPVVADFSDSPLSYYTLAVADGPRHLLSVKGNSAPSLRFGANITSDEDGQPSLSASRDEDDGITVSVVNNNGINPEILNSYSVTANITNTSGKTAYVYAWIDWNNNNIYDTEERVTATVNNNFSGNVTLTWSGITLTGPTGDEGTYARFRVSTDDESVQLPTGEAPDGEVEDYYITYATPLQATPLSVAFSKVNGSLVNGSLNIDWTTVSESNVSHFEVEASKDGKEFVKIASVNSKATNGNSTQKLNYSLSIQLSNPYLLSFSLISLISLFSLLFMKKNKLLIGVFAIVLMASSTTFLSCKKDSNIQKADLSEYKFFRIKQVDKDDKYTYSDVIVVK